MNYEELDASTRQYMRSEFEAEEASGLAYRSKALSPAGLAAFPDMLRATITRGEDISLEIALRDPALWEPTEEHTREGITRPRRRNIDQAARRLALTEFSTWYVRGLARRLIDEGVLQCEVYRGEHPKWEPGECASHEGAIVNVRKIYDGHRRRYWPEPGDPTAFSIPFGPSCHHVIRRKP
jgi:hypothetical protein